MQLTEYTRRLKNLISSNLEELAGELPVESAMECLKLAEYLDTL